MPKVPGEDEARDTSVDPAASPDQRRCAVCAAVVNQQHLILAARRSEDGAELAQQGFDFLRLVVRGDHQPEVRLSLQGD
jgi:hypothetical protein